MHRHGYVGRKLSRERDQRKALIRGLMTNLIMNDKIETTLPKAKELVRNIERVITKAKKGGLHNRRQVHATLNSQEAANRLIEVIAPQLSGRPSGHVRLKQTKLRVGDGAQMATVSFVDNIKDTVEGPIDSRPQDPEDKPAEPAQTSNNTKEDK